EKAGAITELVHENGTSMTCNVEYNQLDPVLKKTINPEGDVPDPITGKSPYPANLNVFIVENIRYKQVLDATDGIIAEFVNPKYADKEKTTFQKPTRLETMMQDLAKVLGEGAKVGFTNFEKRDVFSPVKNNIEAAANNPKSGNYPDSMATGEADHYKYFRKLLAQAGVDINVEGNERTSWGVPYQEGAKVVLSPDFAMTEQEVINKVTGGTISDRSTLIVDGQDITIENLQLDGTLIIKTAPGVKLTIKDLKVSNKGWRFVDLTEEEMGDPHVPTYLKIRGYKLVKGEEEIIEITESGEYNELFVSAEDLKILKNRGRPQKGALHSYRFSRSPVKFVRVWVLIAALSLFTSLSILASPQNSAPAGFYGINAENRDGTDSYNNNLESWFKMISDMGATYVRSSFFWDQIQPDSKEQPYNWQGMDNFILMAKKYNLKIVATLAGTPKWAVEPAIVNSDPDNYREYLPQDNNTGKFAPELYVEFVRAATQRYKPHGELSMEKGWAQDDYWGVTDWQIGNEINVKPNTPSIGWGGTVGQYAQLLKLSYSAVHNECGVYPACNVISGGVADKTEAQDLPGQWPCLWDAVARIYNNLDNKSSAGYFDTLDIHSYERYWYLNNGSDPDAARSYEFPDELWYKDRIERVIEVMRAHGDSDKAIWFGETGYIGYDGCENNNPAGPGCLSEANQAAALKMIYQVSANYPQVEKVFWWQAYDVPYSNNFGLIKTDLSPKLAYGAYKQLTGKAKVVAEPGGRLAIVVLAVLTIIALYIYRYRNSSVNLSKKRAFSKESFKEIRPGSDDERVNFLLKEHLKHFKKAAQVIALAPGRANIMGEHVDYPDFGKDPRALNYSLPMAVEFNVLVSGRKRNDGTVKLYSLDYDRSYEFKIRDLRKLAENRREGNSWSGYVMGLFLAAQEKGMKISGGEFAIQGNVSTGAGMSSSAAYCVAMTMAANDLFGWGLTSVEDLARMAQSGENNPFVGAKVGLLDQMASLTGEERMASLVNYHDMSFSRYSADLGPDYTYIAVHSGLDRSLAQTDYNTRVDELTHAPDVLNRLLKLDGSQQRRHVSAFTLDELKTAQDIVEKNPDAASDEEKIYLKRARHPITERERTLAFVEILEQMDRRVHDSLVMELGRLMTESGKSLSMTGDFQISGTTMDELVEEGLRNDAVGGRMMGGGGGGCAIFIVKTDSLRDWERRVAKGYRSRTGLNPVFIPARPSKGAGIVMRMPKKEALSTFVNPQSPAGARFYQRLGGVTVVFALTLLLQMLRYRGIGMGDLAIALANCLIGLGLLVRTPRPRALVMLFSGLWIGLTLSMVFLGIQPGGYAIAAAVSTIAFSLAVGGPQIHGRESMQIFRIKFSGFQRLARGLSAFRYLNPLHDFSICFYRSLAIYLPFTLILIFSLVGSLGLDPVGMALAQGAAAVGLSLAVRGRFARG
ncbi:MAG: hypothetical protein COV71_02285, partial [Candidatus Omnitrophica bacterium CG11_big_fil_rev_8_21_14_0_20_41_12]